MTELGSFEPLLIPKHERRFTGFDDKIVAMYARGMTVQRDPGFPGSSNTAPRYRPSSSAPSLTPSWPRSPPGSLGRWSSMYPVVFFDALRVATIRRGLPSLRNKAIYLALGVLPDGTRDVLGLWIENTEGAKFWMKTLFNDLKTRGVADILIAVTDGLKGIGEALGAVFPATTLQTCVVHLIRRQPGLRQLFRTASCGRGAQAGLHGRHCGGGGPGPGRLRARHLSARNTPP